MSSWKSFSPLKKILLVAVGILVLVSVIGFGWQKYLKTPAVTSSPKVSYKCVTGKSALSSLQVDHMVELQQTSFGAMVIKIDGVTQTNGKYWQYQVDKKEATIGAEAYLCQGQEEIIWELK